MESQWGSRRYVYRPFRGIVGGIVLLTIGGALLLTNLGMLDSSVVHTWWPLILIALGVGRLLGFSRHYARKPYSDFGPV